MLKKILLTFLAIILFGAIYFLGTMRATGFFRSLETVSYGEVYQEISLPGAEDFTIDYEQEIMVISSTDRKKQKEKNPTAGGLYIMDLSDETFDPIRLNDGLGDGFAPHGIGLFATDSGVYRLLVVNHPKGEHTLEEFRLTLPNQLEHIQTFQHELIVSPNDVVAVDDTRFYFTNDHKNTEGIGLILENYLGRALSNVVYYDGQSFTEAAGGIKYANGINMSQDRRKLLVAAPRAFEVRVYEILEDNSLSEPTIIDIGTGGDNIELDQNGTLWIGSHPNLLHFSGYAALRQAISPSEVISISSDLSKVNIEYLNEGEQVSGSSVAAPYKDYLFIGTVMDDKLLVLKR